MELPRRSGPFVPLSSGVADREKEMIEAALAESQGRVAGPSGAAAKLGIPRQTLDSKIASLGIDKRLFKTRSTSYFPAQKFQVGVFGIKPRWEVKVSERRF